VKPKISNKQLVAIINLINGLKQFQAKGYGQINNLLTMVHFAFPDSILIRYEKDYMSGGMRQYEYSIADINKDGKVLFIDGNFKDIYARYAFLGECKAFDINDENQFEKID